MKGCGIMQDIAQQMLYVKRFFHAYSSELKGDRRGIGQQMRPNDGFVFVLDGECAYEPSQGTPFVARPGDVIYLAKNAGYVMDVGTEGFSYVCVNFEFEGSEQRLCMLASPDAKTETEAYFRRLLRAANRRGEEEFEVMALLYRIYGIVSGASKCEYINKAARETVAESKARMDHDFVDSTLSVALLAREAGMSEAYFRTLFRSQYHTSPLQYLIGLRLGRAISLMSDPLLSLEACAQESGFSSLSYFCRIFKTKMGITPAKYRREAMLSIRK